MWQAVALKKEAELAPNISRVRDRDPLKPTQDALEELLSAMHWLLPSGIETLLRLEKDATYLLKIIKICRGEKS